MICDTMCNNLCVIILTMHLVSRGGAEFMREVAAPDLDTAVHQSSAWSRPGPPYRETNEQYSQGSFIITIFIYTD